MAQAKTNGFQRVEDSKELELIHEEISRTDPAIKIHFTSESDPIDANITLWRVYEGHFEVTLVDPKQLIKEPKEGFFTVFLLSSQILFKSKFEHLKENENRVVFSQPKDIYKVQRRKQLRMPIPDDHTVQVEFHYSDPDTKKQIRSKGAVNDLSLEGIGIKLENTETMQVKSQLSVFITLPGGIVTSKGDVRFKNNERIGVQLAGFSNSDKEVVNRYLSLLIRKWIT